MGTGPARQAVDDEAGGRGEMSEVDGRRARGARNRDAVVTAILELLREGNPDPGAHEIAERSGVSVRSVFRHFDDLESLYEAAVEQMVERSRDLYQPPEAKGSTEARVRALVDQRAALYEDITPTRLAAERLRGRSAAIAQNLGRAHAFAAQRVLLRRAGGRAGGIIFRRIGEDFELLEGCWLRHMFFICSNALIRKCHCAAGLASA